MLGFTSRVRRRLKSDAVPTFFSCHQDSRVDTNTATRKKELQQVPNASGTKCVGENSALTEIKGKQTNTHIMCHESGYLDHRLCHPIEDHSQKNQQQN